MTLKYEQSIHPTSIVHPKAILGSNVRIGPFCVVGEHVVINDDVCIHSHVVIDGITTIGAGCEIYPFAVIGQDNQDLKYKGEPSSVVIGGHTTIREHVTIHRGTEGGGLVTRVGSNCLLMVGVHIAHDCCIGDDVILANQVTLAGHVTIGDRSVLGGLTAVHQFVRIGQGAMVGGLSGVTKDVLPYSLVCCERAALQGLNLVGLKRSGVDKKDIKALKAWLDDCIRGDVLLSELIKQLEDCSVSDDMKRTLSQFMAVSTSRGYTL